MLPYEKKGVRGGRKLKCFHLKIYVILTLFYCSRWSILMFLNVFTAAGHE